MNGPKRVLYLDIDGTVRQGKGDALGKFVNGPDDVHVFPEAVKRMKEWKDAGGLIVGVSNQGGIALGIMPYEQCDAAMVETNRQTGNMFDLISFCRHHPNADDPEMAYCWCRKPNPGAIVVAAEGLRARRDRFLAGGDEWYPPYLGVFVGDRPEDKEVAAAAHLSFMDAGEWRAGAKYPAGYDGKAEHDG